MNWKIQTENVCSCFQCHVEKTAKQFETDIRHFWVSFPVIIEKTVMPDDYNLLNVLRSRIK